MPLSLDPYLFYPEGYLFGTQTGHAIGLPLSTTGVHSEKSSFDAIAFRLAVSRRVEENYRGP